MNNNFRTHLKHTKIFSSNIFPNLKLLSYVRSIQLLLSIVFIMFFNENAYSQISNNGYKFDGINDVVVIPPNYLYQFSGLQFTIELVVNKTSVYDGYSKYLYSNNASNFNSRIDLYLTDSGDVRFNVAGINYSPTPKFRIPDSVCTHIALVVKANRANLYVNGALIQNTSLYYPFVSGSDTLSVGEKLNYYYQKTKGTIKELRLWNIARTQLEIARNIDSVLTPNSDLVGYWRLDSINGQSVPDYSLYHHDGILGHTSIVNIDDPTLNSVCEPCLPNPLIVSPAGLTSMCYGDSVLYIADVQPGNTMQWYFNGNKIVGQVNDSLYLKNSGVYYVKYTDILSGCEMNSNPVQLFANLENALKLSGEHLLPNKKLCINGNIYALYNPGFAYDWYLNGVLQSNANSTFSAYSVGNYYCNITYNGCAITTDTLTAFVQSIDITPSIVPQCTHGQSVTLQTHLTSSINYTINSTYVWKKNGTVISGASGGSYTTLNDGYYQCVYSDTAICSSSINSNSVNVSANSPPNLRYYPAGNSVNFDDCSTIPAYISLGDEYGNAYSDPSSTYVWWYNTLPPISYTNPFVYVSDAGFYEVMITSTCGSPILSPNNYCIYRPIRPDIKIYFDNYTVTPDTLYISMGNYWDSYQWYRDSVQIPGATSNYYWTDVSGNYSCYVTNACGGKFSESFNFQIGQTCDLIDTLVGNSFCIGSYVNLYLKQSNLPFYPSYFTWEYSASPNGPWTSKSTNSSCHADSSGWYRCIISRSIPTSSFYGEAEYYSIPVYVQSYSAAPTQYSNILNVPFLCLGVGNVINASPVQDAIQYVWDLPSNTTVSGSSNALNINLNVSANYSIDSIGIAGKNACGTGPYFYKVFDHYANPGALSIVGQTVGVCDTGTYSYVAINHTPGYDLNWSTSNGINIINGLGQDTVEVGLNPNCLGGNISINQSTWCYSGVPYTLNISGPPAVAGAITGPSIGCSGQTNMLYSITPVYGATNYLWRVPYGSSILSGQGTDSILVKIGFNPGVVSVKTKNACGTSAYNGLYLSIPCKEGNESIEDILVEPNPFSGSILISLGESLIGSKLTLFDVTGKVVYDSFVNESTLRLGEDLIPGVYMLMISNSNVVETKRIIKI